MSHVVLINQLQWSCLSTAASRPPEIAPDRGKRLMSEARGFGPGHDDEDWLLAQSAIDALDASISLRP